MQPEALLQATDFERAVVQVDFSDAPPRQATP
jgi:hypothetical protein